MLRRCRCTWSQTPAVTFVSSTYGYLIVGGVLGGCKGAFSRKKGLVKGCGLVGWVMGNLFQELLAAA